jgi:hypothetical protein
MASMKPLIVLSYEMLEDCLKETRNNHPLLLLLFYTTCKVSANPVKQYEQIV